MNTSISFKLAKLLKEKNIVVKSDRKYNHFLNKEGEEITDQFIYDFYNGHVPSTIDIAKSIFAMSTIPAPIISEVVMWLYEIHGIWIGVELTDNTREFYFQPTIWTSKDREYHDEDIIDQAKSICNWKEWRFNSPIEAYEAAIEHNLNKLI